VSVPVYFTGFARPDTRRLMAGQAGKTTFAREIAAKDFSDTVYLNWDLPKDKKSPWKSRALALRSRGPALD